MTPEIAGGLLKMLSQLSGKGGMPPRTPPIVPPPGGAQTSARPAYNIQNDPMASVGNMHPPRPPAPPGQMQGSGPIGSVIALLGNWHSKKQKNEQQEAANAAEALMQAVDAGKQSGDMTDAYTILHNNEKLFNKVYKGWLQQYEMKQKESQKAKPPEPDVQGFEQGVQRHLSKKQQQAQAQQARWTGPPPPGTTPTRLGPYMLPGASPDQALGQQAMSAERQAQKQDPARSLGTQLTSGERRVEEQAKAGLAVTPKVEAELQKYAAEITKAQTELQKAEAEFKTAQARALTTGKRDEAQLEMYKERTRKAQIDYDIAKQRYLNEVAKGHNREAATKKISDSFKVKNQMLEQAENLLKNMVANKQTSLDDKAVSSIAGMLKTAGATGIAKTLAEQKWYWKTYHNPQELLDAIGEYKEAFQSAFGDKMEKINKPTEGEASDEGDEDTPNEPRDDDPTEGDVIDGYRFKGGDPGNKANWELAKKPN